MSGLEISRPGTPESPLTSSLHHTTTTIEDLTAAIADFSRIPSPEPFATLSCCCGKESCPNLKTWLDLRSTLHKRLVLSAEVGQALLQRQEVYVRQNERRLRHDSAQYLDNNNEVSRSSSASDSLQHGFDELLKEKARLEKQLNHALVNTEVTEVSNKTILQELQEARETISRLTVHHARSVGWETRLSTALKERDDMQQERDSETHRARLAESRFAALKDKTAKLQVDVRRLQESLEEKRLHRLESSEGIIQDAKTRLESFRNSQLGVTAQLAQDELTSVLESLMHDNDVLKRDNAELQHLLAESREQIHGLQEEVDEQHANASSQQMRSGANTPYSRHLHTGSIASINMKEGSLFSPKLRRNGSIDDRQKRRSNVNLRTSPAPPEPQTPDASRSPMSATDSEYRWPTFNQPSPIPSHVSFEIDEDAENEGSPPLFEKPRGHRPLMLLTRSRGTQTEPDNVASVHTPSPFPSHISSLSPPDARSESSSLSETPSTHLGSILDKVVALANKIAQADALTLTNRLKRQHLQGADVGHLSRSTVSNILAETNNLRVNFRFLLEDEKTVSACTRKDLRTLFKFIKDVFTEMGQMRVTLNDVILDPSCAVRISELALNPGKAEAERSQRETGGPASWIAPISKLFLHPGRAESNPGAAFQRMLSAGIGRGGLSAPVGLGRGNSSRGPRLVPKLGPALAPSATTVNVEFSGSGIGRAITSTTGAQTTLIPSPSTTLISDTSPATASSSSTGLMGIFAGAPKPIEPSEPWVVLPSASGSKKKYTPAGHSRESSFGGSSTIGRGVLRKGSHRLSRNVDAVIDNVDRPRDADQQDYLPPLLERTLRRRGLSDSTIHSTFTNHEDMEPASPPSPRRTTPAPTSRVAAWSDRSTVFQALSRTMFNFRQSGGMTTTVSAPVISEPDQPGSSSSGSTQERLQQDISPPSAVTTPSDIPSPHRSDFSAASPSTVDPPLKRTPPKKISRTSHAHPPRLSSPGNNRGVLPNLASWAASSVVIDPVSGSDPFIATSLKDESFMQRSRGTRLGRDEAHVRDFY